MNETIEVPKQDQWKTIWRRWGKDEFRLVSMWGKEQPTDVKLIRGYTMCNQAQLDALAKLGCEIKIEHYRDDYEFE